MTTLVTTEKSIQSACLDWLNTVPGVRCWRQNTGAVLSQYTSKRTGITKKRITRFGQKGQGDIGGIGPNGVRIEIEIKRPGEVPTFEQVSWMEFIRRQGGIAFWCDSLRSCVEQLRYEFYQRGWHWRKEWEVF